MWKDQIMTIEQMGKGTRPESGESTGVPLPTPRPPIGGMRKPPSVSFCECGRVYPCSNKQHEAFNSTTYAKKHLQPKKKKHGGYSADREAQGQFQSGVDKKKFR